MKGQSRVPVAGAIFAMFTLPFLCGIHLDGRAKSLTRTGELKSCPTKTQLALTIHEFSSTRSFPELEAARLRLMNSARLSSKCRRQVIDTIIEAMDKPQLDVYRDFHLWRHGSRLLGDLKATEGLDLLIKHLSFTDGMSINTAHYPAMLSVMKIGQPAIPKLGVALRQNADSSYRFNAVFCIAQIGGPRAIQELRSSLAAESNSCVHKFIQVSIEVLDNPRAPGQITGEDNKKWFAALGCKE